MLVFGLGYDSELWYNATGGNTYFVEHDQTYIDLNPNIDSDHIIYFDYKGIDVQSSFQLKLDEIHKFVIPEALVQLAPFDIILIDGPSGYTNLMPGRLLPIFWSVSLLSSLNTIIFLDDTNRSLEKYCIQRFFTDYNVQFFNERGGFALCSRKSFFGET